MNSKRSVHLIIMLAFMVAAFSACNNKKYLASNEFLYTGAELSINSNGNKIEKKSALIADLEGVIYPEPNTELFGVARPKLWFYNITKEPEKEKGFRYWLKYKIGRPPVLLDGTDPVRIKKLITNRLYNKGYFKADVDYNIKFGKKEAKIEYQIKIEKAYKIDTVFFPEPENFLSRNIEEKKQESFLKKGNVYDLEVIKSERQRISKNLRSKGFYYFEPNFLLMEVDSTLGGNRVNVYIKIKENIEDKYLDVYKLNDIYVIPNYDLRGSLERSNSDTLSVNEYLYLNEDSAFRPEKITEAIYIKPNQYFSAQGHEYTINKLIGLGAFQFVTIRYYPDSAMENRLNAFIQLTPHVRKSIRLEFTGTTKSNGFTGPGFNTTFKNRNTFRGAELLSINLETGYETQFSSSAKGLNSYQVGINAELDIPRFLLPFGLKSNLSRYTPKTVFKVGLSTLNRVQFYRLNSIDASYGYKWRESKSKLHTFNPISINYVKLANSEPAFESILNENPLIRRSFEEQFILGSIYSFTYDSRLQNASKSSIYYKGTAELSGSTMQLASSLGDGNSFGEETDYELLGTRFNQYARFENTFKYFLKFNKNNVWANRVIIGAGIPFGNSNTLPFIKTFFIGGGNSIRAFQARTLGPGTYTRTEDGSEGIIFVDQSGDIKLEFNSEYRFDIYTIFKGALFLDAGNIWLINDDPKRPGGKFEVDTFTNEYAAGTGFGLRIDPDFFVIRLDVGFPLRNPSLPAGERWIIDEFGKDAVFNIAIGYPF